MVDLCFKSLQIVLYELKNQAFKTAALVTQAVSYFA